VLPFTGSQVAPPGESYEGKRRPGRKQWQTTAGYIRDSLHVTCGLTACTPGSAPGPTLGNEYGKLYLFTDFSGLSTDGLRSGDEHPTHTLHDDITPSV